MKFKKGDRVKYGDIETVVAYTYSHDTDAVLIEHPKGWAEEGSRFDNYNPVRWHRYMQVDSHELELIEEEASQPKFQVGDRVRYKDDLYSGIGNLVEIDEGDRLPYQVKMENGRNSWFTHDEVSLVEEIENDSLTSADEPVQHVILAVNRKGKFIGLRPDPTQCGREGRIAYEYEVVIEGTNKHLTDEGFLIDNGLVDEYFQKTYTESETRCKSCELMACDAIEHFKKLDELADVDLRRIKVSIRGSEHAFITGEWRAPDFQA